MLTQWASSMTTRPTPTRCSISTNPRRRSRSGAAKSRRVAPSSDRRRAASRPHRRDSDELTNVVDRRDRRRQVVDLVLHQRDQGREDQRRARRSIAASSYVSDFPAPVGITATVSRPATAARTTSSWPGRKASKPKCSRRASWTSIRTSVRGRSEGEVLRFRSGGLARPRPYNQRSVATDLDQLTRNAVDLLPDGLPRAQARARATASGQARDRRHLAGHPPRAGVPPRSACAAFQDAGHTGVLIVGDYTTRIGDPSGRSAERPILAEDEIDRNARTYVDQAMLVLDRERTEVRFNGEWLAGARLRGGAPPHAHDDGRAAPRARRLREAVRGARADLGLRAPLPADAGLRLGRRRGRRRDRRHRPALQPARRAHRDGALRARAAGRADDAAPRLLGRGEDELVESATTSR